MKSLLLRRDELNNILRIDYPVVKEGILVLFPTMCLLDSRQLISATLLPECTVQSSTPPSQLVGCFFLAVHSRMAKLSSGVGLQRKRGFLSMCPQLLHCIQTFSILHPTQLEIHMCGSIPPLNLLRPNGHINLAALDGGEKKSRCYSDLS